VAVMTMMTERRPQWLNTSSLLSPDSLVGSVNGPFSLKALTRWKWVLLFLQNRMSIDLKFTTSSVSPGKCIKKRGYKKPTKPPLPFTWKQLN
jgi:hypothetical protein